MGTERPQSETPPLGSFPIVGPALMIRRRSPSLPPTKPSSLVAGRRGSLPRMN